MLRYLINLINLIPNFFQILRIVNEIQPEIIHIHYINELALSIALMRFHPFIVTVWGSDILVTPRKLKILNWMVGYVLRKTDLITCDAEHMKQAMVQLGVDASKIKIIYFGTDVKKFCPEARSQTLRQELDFDNHPVVISLRSFEPIYDIETLIRAVPLVLKEAPETNFLIIGRGSQESKLKKLAEASGVLDKIKFTGWIPNDELPRYLASADIYISTSLSDAGLAASTAEAMACELPVVVTDFGENREWVRNQEGGFVIPLSNSQLLAEKIIYLVKNRDARRNFGRFNRKIIEEKNNYYLEMKKMEEVYNSVKNEFFKISH
jgi:glycosyltransferase involved in cell wall biosynthesis